MVLFSGKMKGHLQKRLDKSGKHTESRNIVDALGQRMPEP